MRNIIIVLLITFKGYSQLVNKTNDGYTEVVDGGFLCFTFYYI